MRWLPAIGTGGRWLLLLGLALVGALLVGPVKAQDATTIAQAQAALEAARSTRAVRALAAPELDAAERALERALAARDAGRAPAEVEHLAYLAERRAAVARMRAEERLSALALRSLSATHALISEARAAEAEAAERRALQLARRLQRFDVRPDRHGLLLTPRERWFAGDLAPARRAVLAIAEAARLLGALPEREAAVLGYAMRGAPAQDGASSGAAAAWLPAGHREVLASPTAAGPDDLGCVRADVVRALLISHGVDPRRIVARCVLPQGALGTAEPVAALPAGETAMAILPHGSSARAPTIGQAVPGSAAR
jgi:outer membrane protein OmpA-like peptidoglycan-associated protein